MTWRRIVIKKAVLVLLIGLMMGLLSGCGNHDSESQKTSGADTDVSTEIRSPSADSVTRSADDTLNIVIKGVKLPFPCTVSQLKEAGFAFYSEYRSSFLAIDNLTKPGDTDMTPVGIGTDLGDLHEVIVQIKADESETISEDSVTVVRVLLNANCDAKVNDCLRYGMNLDEAIKELGQATATILAMDPEDYSKGQTVLCWEMGSYEIVISASDGIVTEIDIHMLD